MFADERGVGILFMVLTKINKLAQMYLYISKYMCYLLKAAAAVVVKMTGNRLVNWAVKYHLNKKPFLWVEWDQDQPNLHKYHWIASLRLLGYFEVIRKEWVTMLI